MDAGEDEFETWRDYVFETPPAVDDGSTDIAAYLDTATLCSDLRTLADLSTEVAAMKDGTDTSLRSAFREEDLRREYLGVSRAEIAGTLVISFGGLVQGMGGVSIHEFVGACRRAGACTLFVRDRLQSWYLRDTRPHSAAAIHAPYYDPFSSLLDLLHAEIEIVRPKKVVCIGASMGGYAALRAGLCLRAASVLVFGPQIFLRTAERSALGLPRMFFDDDLGLLGTRCAGEGLSVDSVVAIHAGLCRSAVDGSVAPLTTPVATGPCVGSQRECVPWRVAQDGATPASLRPATLIELHVGENARADLHEAALLQEATAAVAATQATAAADRVTATAAASTSANAALVSADAAVVTAKAAAVAVAAAAATAAAAAAAAAAVAATSIDSATDHVSIAAAVAAAAAATDADALSVAVAASLAVAMAAAVAASEVAKEATAAAADSVAASMAPMTSPAQAMCAAKVVVHVHPGLGHPLAKDIRDAGLLEAMLRKHLD